MTNLEWFNEIGMIAENEVWTKTSDLKGQIGVNLVIALRDDDFKKYSEKGFDWLLEEHKEPIKLTKFEYDLLMSYINKGYYFENYSELKEMRNKGYFKGITDTSMKIVYILNNCEVIE
jgi:hypothetical protein|nr:MAG TPA: hypothetical protein [Caudoviricetes sp.]